MPNRAKRSHVGEKDINAALRLQQAFQMRQLGYTYERIATQCGYGSRAAAFNAVQRELKRTITPVAEDVRELELTRLDQLLTVFYAKAMKGDGWSLDRVLRIMERRSAYLGLDVPVGSDTLTAAKVVIREYPSEWVTALPPASPSAIPTPVLQPEGAPAQ